MLDYVVRSLVDDPDAVAIELDDRGRRPVPERARRCRRHGPGHRQAGAGRPVDPHRRRAPPPPVTVSTSRSSSSTDPRTDPSARGRPDRQGARAPRRGRGRPDHRPHRAARPGSERPAAGDRAPDGRRSPRPHQRRWIVRFEGVADRDSAEPLAGAVLRAEADRGRRRALGPRARRLRGRRAPTAPTGAPSRRCRPTPPATSSCSTPARSCRSCSSSSATPTARLVVDVPAGLFDLPRPDAGAGGAHRRLHDLPRHGRRASPARASSGGRRQRACSTCGSTTCASTPPTCTAPSTTRRSAAAPAWCCMPEPIFAAVEAAEPPRPLLPARPRRAHASTRRMARELAAGDGFCLLCGRYEGVDERVREPPRRRRAVDRRLRARRRRGGGHGRLEAVGRLVPGVMGNEASAERRVFSRRAARVPAVHPAGDVPGLGGARGAALGRPRPGRALAPGPGPRAAPSRAAPTSSRPGAGSRADERGLLAEFARRP